LHGIHTSAAPTRGDDAFQFVATVDIDPGSCVFHTFADDGAIRGVPFGSRFGTLECGGSPLSHAMVLETFDIFGVVVARCVVGVSAIFPNNQVALGGE
jgi:hypothetical protein